jgi:transcriptional regulator EpsA
MSELILLDRQEEEHLIRVLEYGVTLKDARQFYMWTQGPLQGLIAHKALLCVHLGPQRQVLRLDCFHSPQLPEKALDVLTGSHSSILLQLLTESTAAPLSPRWHAFEELPQGGAHRQDLQRLKGLGITNALTHGAPTLAGGTAHFMFLAVQPAQTPQRTAYLLELLLPQLHLSLTRLTLAAQSTPAQSGLAAPLSTRELDILRWVAAGKTNQEIAEVLFISPFTVKNHVQNILKKLKVKNRMQAAALSQRTMSV